MNSVVHDSQSGFFSSLRSLLRERDPREHCELCGAGLQSDHQHLLDPATRKLMCTCNACVVLFHSHGDTKYKRVPCRLRRLRNFRLTDVQWNELMIPIGMAFFLKNDVEGRVLALYPSPAGATESTSSLTAWDDIVRDNPILDTMEPDVEALLANRLGDAGEERNGEYYLVPIDKCYELVGLIRTNWRGLSGGTEVWQEIRSFFDGLNARAVWESANA